MSNHATNFAPNIAVVGASGIVGREAISILASRNHPPQRLKLFGSARSVGDAVEYIDSSINIQHLDGITQCGFDFVLLCAASDVAHFVRDALADTSSVLIDNSSAFRMDPDVPLVIPEVNGHLLNDKTKFVANPNCSTIMMLAALNPLRASLGIRGVIATTYQAVSGAGIAAMTELHNQSRSYLNNQPIEPEVFPVSCAFNIFEHESNIDPISGFNGEELKMIQETRRIWDTKDLSVLPTCVRVGVERAHSQSLLVELNTSSTADHIRHILQRTGLSHVPDGHLLTPRDVSGKDDVFIGRIRIDPLSSGRRVLLWICCDQLRKGAALNAIQIMDLLQRRDRR
jgi:aspartate-semialdehyde dehydrogenase